MPHPSGTSAQGGDGSLGSAGAVLRLNRLMRGLWQILTLSWHISSEVKTWHARCSGHRLEADGLISHYIKLNGFRAVE